MKILASKTATARRRHSFTLIELMIVIGIIAILAALAFPAIDKARAKSRQAKCLNNLHQLSIGVISYRIDHDEKMPLWLSALAPPLNSYIDSTKGVFICASDRSSPKGSDGSKPNGIATDIIGDQYSETDDITGNPSLTRNSAVEDCSYLYEFCDAPCSWGWADYLWSPSPPVTMAEVDKNGDGVASWGEVKQYQLQHGDQYHPGEYMATAFPIIRCFHHYNERIFTVVTNIDTGTTVTEGMTLNVSYAGNIFMAPIKWEYGLPRD